MSKEYIGGICRSKDNPRGVPIYVTKGMNKQKLNSKIIAKMFNVPKPLLNKQTPPKSLRKQPSINKEVKGVKPIKAWALVNKKGKIVDTSYNGWDFFYGIFRTKKEHTPEFGNEIIPVLISPLSPNKKGQKKVKSKVNKTKK